MERTVEQSIIFSRVLEHNEQQGLYHRDYTNRQYLVNEGQERLKGSNLFLEKENIHAMEKLQCFQKKVSNYGIMSNSNIF